MTDIQYILDKQEIIDLTYRYAWAVDDQYWHDLENIFATDATALYAGEYLSDRGSIIEFIENTQKNTTRSKHIVSSPIININGTDAKCKSMVQGYHFKINGHGSDVYIIIGSYYDDLIKINNIWQIKHREFQINWSTGKSSLMTRSAPILPEALR